MELREIGEFGFIDRLKPRFDNLLSNSLIGIGDDCAVIPANEHEDWVVTTDMLIEGVHFIRESITPEELGYKCLAVNLSDIASMGAMPMGSFLSIAIPTSISVEYLDEFMDGYLKLSEFYHTPLLGGDTTRSLQHLAINIVAIGKCAKGEAKMRSHGMVGDIVAVTGNLGDSAAGLQLILKGIKETVDHSTLIEKHHAPHPRILEGQFFSGKASVHAMMDISDGIGSDLYHLLRGSRLGAIVNLECLPLSEELKRVSEQNGWDPLDLAVGGGEDYELLLTIAADDFVKLNHQFASTFGHPLYPIGSLIKGEPLIDWRLSNKTHSMAQKGFNHFSL